MYRKCVTVMYRYCVVAFIFVATQYLMSKRIRGTGFIPLCCTYMIPILKSDSEIPMYYVCDGKREKKKTRERKRGREIGRARASRDRVIISPLNFLIPHPFTHPAATSSFLRESPRGIAIWCIPDVFLTRLLTRISGRRYQRHVARKRNDICTTRIVSVLSLCTWIPFTQSIHPISVFRYIDSHLAMRRNDALQRDSS